MKNPTLPLLCCAFLSLGFNAYSGEKVIIDTDFSQVNKDDVPLATNVAFKESDYPLKRPTGRTDIALFSPPSSVVTSKQAVKGLAAPFALITVRKMAPENIVPNQSPFAYAGLSWDLRAAPLEQGVYELSWTQLSITDLEQLLMRVTLAHRQTDGTLQYVEGASKIPLNLVLTKSDLGTCEERANLAVGKPHEFKMKIDTVKNNWSLTVDGKSLFRNKTFPPDYLNQFKTFLITAVSFGGGISERLNTDEVKYGISQVKLVKLNE